MKLHFLGQPYSRDNHQVETLPSEYTARFMGRNYVSRRPVTTARPQLVFRQYRGVAYM